MANGDRVQVLLGAGNGTFGTLKSSYFTKFLNGWNIAVGDVNNDGNLDIASGTNAGWGAWYLSVALGNGDGTFQDPVSYSMPCCGGVRTTTLVDLNGDGWLDLVGGEAGTQVRIFLNNGNGTFPVSGTSTVTQLGNNPQDAAVGDFNNDGNADVALANRDAGGSIQVLLGDGAGALASQPLLPLAPGEAGRNLAVGDFNGDHCDDIAHINLTGRAVDVYLSTCNGMGTRTSYVFDAVGPTSSGYRLADEVVDLDGDGALDLVIANSGGRGRKGNAIFVLHGNGNGTFGPASAYPNPVEPPPPPCCSWINEAIVFPTNVLVSDLNGDGQPDLTTTANNDRPVAVLLQAGEPPDTTAPVISGTPSPITAEATSASGATVTYTLPTASDNRDGSVAVSCSPASGSTFPIGMTPVTCSAEDAHHNPASTSFTVTVVDTTAPAVTSITPSVSVLWPPNGKLVSVSMAVVATDAVSAAPACSVTGVTSSQAVTGDGDWVITPGSLTVQLRSERAGGIKAGRTYTVTVTCTDAAGNASAATAIVLAPHDLGKK